jgi:DNA-binding IclR family transcriptional regulator
MGTMKIAPRHRSPVVDKATQLLDVLASAPSGRSLAELVEQLGLARSTVYRILNSLVVYGAIEKDAQEPVYRLGPKLSELARLLGPQNDRAALSDIAAPVMDTLVHRIGEACKLSVRDGDDVLTIRVAQSPQEYGLTIRVGHRAPIQAGGSSKAILAHLPAAEINRLLEAPLKAYTPFTITDADMMREVLSQVRRQGYSEDNSEITSGIRSVASPIFGSKGQVAGALGVPYLGDPVPERLRAIRQAVMEAARTISISLGAPRPLINAPSDDRLQYGT